MPKRPGKGSVFSGLRNYYNVWPYVPEWDFEDDMPPAGTELLFQRQPVPPDNPAFLYLGNLQHDAGVFGVELMGDAAELRMNDYEAWRLANAYIDALGEKAWSDGRRGFLLKPAMPVTFRFEGLKEFHVFQTQRFGRLSRLKHALKRNLAIQDEFRRDLVISPGPRDFVGVFEVGSWLAREIIIQEERRRGLYSASYHSCTVLLCVSCDELKVIEGQRQAWEERFGADTVWILDRFNEERRKKRFIGLQEIEAFLEEVGAV